MTTTTDRDDLLVPVPANADLAVRVRGLRKHYGETKACDGVDLDVVRGEVLALLGPNGAGKTTTTEILEGYRHRDGGEVAVLGVDPGKGDRHWRTRLGIVLQSANDLGDLTVEESLNHFAGYYPRPRGIDEVIEAVGLTEKRRTKGFNLSGGQRRRLDVALGIIGSPELLFLDEPTSGVDPVARRRFWDLLYDLAGRGVTLFVTTHYMDEATNCSRLALMYRGRIVADGTPREVRLSAATASRPDPTLEDAFVALIGESGPDASAAGGVQVVRGRGDGVPDLG